MIKYFFLLTIVFSNNVNAGFWSDIASHVVADQISNSISGSSNRSNEGKLDSEQTEEMKIQQALYGLGFYNNNLDGNLNTRESRKAINELQKSRDIKTTGILAENNRQHLLYIHELYTALIKIQETPPINEKNRNMIYDEIDLAILLIQGGE